MAHTPEETEQMRRALAEKVMGWTVDTEFQWLRYDGALITEPGYIGKNGFKHMPVKDWQPDVNWQQMGLVVEAMVGRGYDYDFYRDRCYHAHVINVIFWLYEGDPAKAVTKRADTLPSAIAWAAFEAVKGGTDDGRTTDR